MKRRDSDGLPIGPAHGRLLTAQNIDNKRRVARVERKLTAIADRHTTLPALPNDGQIIHYQTDDMKSEGVCWQFRYNSENVSSYKWEFVGGGFLEDNTGVGSSFETTASTSYVNLATTGPEIYVPLDGQYIVTTWANSLNSGAGNLSYAAVDTGSGAGDSNAAVFTGNTQAVSGSSSALMVITAGTTVTMKYRVTAGTGSWRHRRMTIIPVRVG